MKLLSAIIAAITLFPVKPAPLPPKFDPITEVDLCPEPGKLDGDHVLKMWRVELYGMSGRKRIVHDYEPLDDWQKKVGSDIDTFEHSTQVVQ